MPRSKASEPVEPTEPIDEPVSEPIKPIELAEPTMSEALAEAARSTGQPVVEPRIEPQVALTPEQVRIKELEAQLALLAGKADPQPDLERVMPGEGDILIHVVSEGGFTALGHVWFRGQEIEFKRGGGAYADTCDRLGRSWLDLDENAQIDKYGEVMFRPGPWQGKTYVDAKGATLTHPLRDSDGKSIRPPTEDELAAAAAAERRRGRAAPRLPRA